MELKIYNQQNVLKATVSPGDSSTNSKGIMDDNVLTLSFKHYDCFSVDVNDYADFAGERFWALERYTPNQTSTLEWEYNIKLYGIESLIKRIINLKLVDDEMEPVFSLTAPAIEHVRLFVANINRAMSTSSWKVGEVIATPNLTVDYSGTFINKGLDEVAGLANTEWWIEDKTINLSRCEHSAEITLGYHNGLLSISRDTNENAPFFTRLFPIGSTRNIDRTYYGYSRLQLPSGNKYVEQNTQYGVIEHFEETAFATIYPRRIGTVGTVRNEQRTGEDGNPFTIYYFTDPQLNFNPNSYEIAGLVKNVVFQSGELNGRDFEVNWNQTTLEFEIITQFPYDDDTQLPGGALIPTNGDQYILYNLRMPNEYYAIAEAEFAQAVQDYMDKNKLDKSVYKAPTDYIDLTTREIDLTLGQVIRLESDEFFPGVGYRLSRITRITRKVNNPQQADIEISDTVDRGKMAALEGSIAETNHYIQTAMGGLPDIIKSWETTKPTDTNLFSARRSLREFISKKNNDSAEGLITFLQGAKFGNYSAGQSGGTIDQNGNAEMLTAVIRSMLRSTTFVDGLTGEGFGLWKDGNGLANLTLDKLTVRQTMSVMELLINKVRSVGGQMIVSAANGKIKSVTQTGNNYVITFDTENTFVENDLMRCSTFTGNALKSYWVEIASADGNTVTVPMSEFSGSVPAEGDECVLMGNSTNTLRQNLISIAATEDGQPRVDVLDGVHEKNFNGCLRARLGNLDGINDSWFPAENQPHGDGLYADNAYLRGTFLLVTGEDIRTKFEITEGLIESSVEGVRQDFVEDKGYLSNPTFGEGMNKWDTENEATFFLLNNKWIWLNDNIYSKKGDFATVRKDAGRTVVFIRNKYISQTGGNMKNIPEMITNSDGKKEPQAVYLSFFYRCQTAGTLTVEFENVDKTGFVDFDSINISKDIDVTDGYKQFSGGGMWNGTGDFKLSFTGEIYMYMLVLTVDRIESLTYKYQTLFEQSEKLIKIAATSFDADGNPLQSSKIVTKADMNLIATGLYSEDGSLTEGAGLITKSNVAALFAIGADGTLQSFIGASTEGVKIKASNITLEGLVTANQNFLIDEDGNMWAMDCHISGEINAESGYIGGFAISNGRIGMDGTATGGGGGLILTEDFIRVGGSDGYVMFGDDVIPSSAGGAFTAVGRIVNNAANTGASYGFDTSNYGLFINVTGGTKNYGIDSNAPLKAPAFINTKIKALTFSGSSYSIDFTQASVFLIYATQQYNITLPTEASVASMFSLASLPSDFGFCVTFKIRTGSAKITLTGIYNSNESSSSFDMDDGDSIVLLVSKIDGFRYNVLNYST